MIPVLLFVIYVVLVWTGISAEEATLQIQERVFWIAAPLMVFPPWWICLLFITIPAREQRSEERIAHLRKRLTPRFQIEALNGGAPVQVQVGTGVTTTGGARITNLSGNDEIICLGVKNLSDRPSDICEAQLVELVGDNGSQLSDPIMFKWRGIGDPDSDWTVIPSKSMRTAKAFTVISDRIYFAVDKLPVDYVNFFDGGKRFAGKIAFSDRYCVSGSLLCSRD
jgi:hypothetical protein